MCGEKSVFMKVKLFDIGSPPRVRGEDFNDCRKSIRYGITPACAGRRRSIKVRRLSTSDHPRVCGEKTYT